jgi:dienelactone hydrolase
VLVPDPLGQGERLQHYDPELRASRAGSSTDEHNQAALRASLVGDQVARYFIWDAMRALDYLLTRPEVDPARVGATGCSGGGTVATYLAALDQRVKAAAIACYLTDWDHLLGGPGPQEAEQTFPGFLKAGLDMADYVALIAPRPLLIAATTDDFFPLPGARAVHAEGRRLYGLAGAADRISFFVGPGGHGTPRESREAISAFFLRWLGQGGDASEPPDPRLDPEDLACTTTGQVATSLKAKTVADLVAQAAPGLAHGRKLPRTDAERTAHRRLFAEGGLADIARRPGGPAPAVTVHRAIERAGYRLEVISFRGDGGITLWGLLAVPAGPEPRPAALLVDPRLRTTLADPGGDLDQLARAGRVVLALEPRGAAVEPEPSGRGSLLGSAAGLQRRAEVVGRTLVGLRAEDVLAATDLLAARPDVDSRSIGAFAHGPYAVPLLHAAALDARLGRVVLRDMLPVYRAVLDRSIHKNLPEIAIPGVLRRYDLDDLMVAVAPRPITLVNPLDATAQPMPLRELDRHLGPARESIRLAGGTLEIVRKGTPALLLDQAGAQPR